MGNELFVVALAGAYSAVLWWGCVRLPRADRQILACVPIRQTSGGLWMGINLTYYGLILATAQCAAVTLFCILMGSLGYPLWIIALPAAVMIGICVAASRIIARIVEKKKDTFTVGGASFAGLILSPFVLSGINAAGFASISAMPFLAALAASYAVGEGIGRLGCISFGCCYGKPLDSCHPYISRLFRHFHFTFCGGLKKAAYEGGLDNVPVVPVQAVTSVLSFAAGLLSTYLFLKGLYSLSLLTAVLITQLWRFASEFLRSDHRGAGRISAYQYMSLGMAITSVVIVLCCKAGSAAPIPQAGAGLSKGLGIISTAPYVIFIEALWVVIFLFTGRSTVTGSKLSLFLHRDRI